MIHERINKGILKFLVNKEAMIIDYNPFPLVASANTTIATDLRISMDAKKR